MNLVPTDVSQCPKKHSRMLVQPVLQDEKNLHPSCCRRGAHNMSCTTTQWFWGFFGSLAPNLLQVLAIGGSLAPYWLSCVSKYGSSSRVRADYFLTWCDLLWFNDGIGSGRSMEEDSGLETPGQANEQAQQTGATLFLLLEGLMGGFLKQKLSMQWWGSHCGLRAKVRHPAWQGHFRWDMDCLESHQGSAEQ